MDIQSRLTVAIMLVTSKSSAEKIAAEADHYAALPDNLAAFDFALHAIRHACGNGQNEAISWTIRNNTLDCYA